MGWGAKKDPATGRSKREAVGRQGRKGGPLRSNGKIVRKGRLEFQRAKAESRPRPQPWRWL